MVVLLKGRVQLLAAQKLINRPGWWKGKFVLFQMLAIGVGEEEGESYIKVTAFFCCKKAYCQSLSMFYNCDENAIKISSQHPERSLLFAVGRTSAVSIQAMSSSRIS